MTRLAVLVPDDLGAWAEARAVEAQLGGASDYLVDLLRREREQVEKRASLLAAIDEGLASPIVDTTIDDIIARGKVRHGLA